MTRNVSDEEMGRITHVEAKLNSFIEKRAKAAKLEEADQKTERETRERRERWVAKARADVPGRRGPDSVDRGAARPDTGGPVVRARLRGGATLARRAAGGAADGLPGRAAFGDAEFIFADRSAA